jgi:hypothetical protein
MRDNKGVNDGRDSRRQAEAVEPQVVKDGARAGETTSLPLPLAKRRKGQKLSSIGVALSGEGKV